MKKISNTFLSLCLTFILGSVPALVLAHGGGHSHAHDVKPVTKKVAIANAKIELLRLAKEDIIDKSWKDGVFESIKDETFGRRKEWVVNFSNKKGKKGKQIYIFLKLSGSYIAANFSGK